MKRAVHYVQTTYRYECKELSEAKTGVVKEGDSLNKIKKLRPQQSRFVNLANVCNKHLNFLGMG